MLWENLTIDEFEESLNKTKGVILAPIGCLEKHGSHMPIGTDIFVARAISIRVSEIEPVMVFPFMPFGIVGEVKHKKGTISLTSNLIYHMLEELCDELARNGYNKIIFVDGHGGNTNFLKYFMQSRLENPHPYITYYFDNGNKNSDFWRAYQEKFGRVLTSGHACEFETSAMLDINASTIKMDRINVEETSPLHRLDYLAEAELYTSINWYADYPAQIAGDPSKADLERGKYLNDYNVNRLTKIVRLVKEDTESVRLLNEYYSKQKNPEGF